MKKLRGKQKRAIVNRNKLAGPHFKNAYKHEMQTKFNEALKWMPHDEKHRFDDREKLTPFQQIALSRGMKILKLRDRKQRRLERKR